MSCLVLYCIKLNSTQATHTIQLHTGIDCSQPPYFSVGSSRPVGFDGTAAIFVYISERDLGRVSKLPRGAGVGVIIVGEIALAYTEAYRSGESHGKIGGL